MRVGARKPVPSEGLRQNVQALDDQLESRILPLREVRQRAEAAAVREALALTGGNISRAAELLGVTRPTLYDLMERIARRAPNK